MKKYRGFTLIELLAVIVILAVISLIATPLVLNVIEKSKKAAFEQTLNGVLDAARLYQIQTAVTDPITDCRYFSFSSDVDSVTVRDDKTYYPVKDLKLKGKVPTEGEVKVCSYDIKVDASDGKYAGSSDGTTTNISSGDLSSNDFETPIIDVFNVKASIDRLVVTVSAHSPSVGGIISNYYYKIDGGDYIKSDSKSHIFEDLKPNQEYEISVKVENKSGVTTEETKKVTTSAFGTITVNVSDSDKWTTSKTVEITGTTSEYVLEYKIKKYNFDTNTDEETTYAEYTDKFEISDIATAEHPVVIVARYKSGENVSNQKDKNIVNIDPTVPSISVANVSATTNSIFVTYAAADAESDIKETKCVYGLDETYGTNGTVKDNKCIISGIKSGTTYYYKLTTTNNSGLTAEKEGNTNSYNITAPSISYTNDPTTIPDSGFLNSQIIKVEFNTSNVENPVRYIKTTRAGTSSVAGNACGTDTLPGTCESSTTKNFAANVWYKVSSDASVTYNVSSSDEGTIYAVLYDGTNYSTHGTGKINKIYYDAADVSYTTTYNSSVTNVEQALDDLNSKIK